MHSTDDDLTICYKSSPALEHLQMLQKLGIHRARPNLAGQHVLAACMCNLNVVCRAPVTGPGLGLRAMFRALQHFAS